MELLVVIAIIGILIALLLPAVQAAREAALAHAVYQQRTPTGPGVVEFREHIQEASSRLPGPLGPNWWRRLPHGVPRLLRTKLGRDDPSLY